MSAVPTITSVQADSAFAAAQRVVETHRRLVNFIKAGQTLAQIDAEVARVLRALSCTSAFRGYKPYRSKPAFPSHACLSVNDCIVHGTAGSYLEPLKRGDLLSLDIGVVHRGWVGDAAWTYAIQEAPEPAQRLMRCGMDSLRLGIKTLRAGAPYTDWARTVQQHVERECGFFCVRGLGGHGYGRYVSDKVRGLHKPPFVPNVIDEPNWTERKESWQVGTLVAVEPMISIGTGATNDPPSVWPIKTADGSLSVHYEADILITASGPRDLTEGMDSLPEIIG